MSLNELHELDVQTVGYEMTPMTFSFISWFC